MICLILLLHSYIIIFQRSKSYSLDDFMSMDRYNTTLVQSSILRVLSCDFRLPSSTILISTLVAENCFFGFFCFKFFLIFTCSQVHPHSVQWRQFEQRLFLHLHLSAIQMVPVAKAVKQRKVRSCKDFRGLFCSIMEVRICSYHQYPIICTNTNSTKQQIAKLRKYNDLGYLFKIRHI